MSMPPTAAQGDPFAALHSLSGLFDPHLKTLALLALFASPLGIFSGFKAFPLSLATSPALLGAAFIFGGNFRPGSTRNDAQSSAAQSGEPGAVAKDSSGMYLKAGLVSYLIFQVAQPYSLETLVIPAVPSWAVWAFGAAAVATALFLPTTRLYGPLRFVYLECLQSIFPSAPSQSNWLLYPIFLLAFGPTMLSEAANKLGNTGGIALAVAAWVYTYRAYDAQLRAITEDVGRHTSVAKIALDTAREHAATTARYEGHLLGEGLMREDSAMASHAGAATAMQRGRLDKKDESATAPNQSDVSFEIALAAAETARLAEKAVSAARDGDMAGARQDAEAAKATANNTISLMEAVRQEMLKTRGQVRSSLKR